MFENVRKEISYVSPEIGIAQAIVHKTGKTMFAILKDNHVRIEEKITLTDGTVLVPISEDSDLLKNDFIVLPPYPIPYDTEEDLFIGIRDFIGRYFSINKGFSEIAALYVMLTWVYERFDELPYLRVMGTLGTGKSRFLKTLKACAYHSIMLGSSSVAAMFRTIDHFKGTFILDEADFKNTEFSSDVAKILNNGHAKGTPIARMREKTNSKGEFTTDVFQVFGPKVLASREAFVDAALESRCFAQRLYPVKNIQAPISLGDTFQQEAKKLRGQLLMFRFRNYPHLVIKELKSDKIRNGRIMQIAQPLWNIALLIGDYAVQRVINQAIIMDEHLISDQSDTEEADVLISIMRLAIKPDIKIHVKRITSQYNHYFGGGSQRDNDNYGSVRDYKLDLADRKIGEIMGKKLHLRKLRDNKGMYIRNDKQTNNILISLCERYGITEDMI